MPLRGTQDAADNAAGFNLKAKAKWALSSLATVAGAVSTRRGLAQNCKDPAGANQHKKATGGCESQQVWGKAHGCIQCSS